jgi:hypothetical protein
MRRCVIGFLIILILLVLPHRSYLQGEGKLPDLSVRGVSRTASEMVAEQRHSWKIPVRGDTPPENVSIVIEAVEGVSVNPSLHSSGAVDFSSLQSIVRDIAPPGMTDEQKALSIWRFVMDNLYHGPWGTCFDGLEHLTVYGYGYCGTFAAVLEPLWWAAGLKARHVNTGNHAGTEVYYDDDWHYLDAHLRCFFLERDNRTIASLDELNRDPSLWDMKRQRGSSKVGAKKYYYMSVHPNGSGRSPEYSNKFVLAKGDVLTLTWQEKGKWCNARGWEGGGKPAPEPDIYANGTFRFHRDLTDPGQSRTSLVSSLNMDWRDPSSGYLHPLKAGEDAILTYEVRVPYFIPEVSVSGKFEKKRAGDMVRIDISTDNGQSWTQLCNAEGIGAVSASTSTTKTQEVTTDRMWKYSYMIRVRMRAEASPRDVGAYVLESTADLFYNPRGLPALVPGDNTVAFHDEGTSSRSVKVTYSWEENLPIRISKDFPISGEEVVLSAEINNTGGGEAKDVPVVFYLGDPAAGGKEIGRDVIKRIAPAGKGYAKVRWKAARSIPRQGAQSSGALLYVKVDPDNRIQELDKKNNTAFRVVKVLHPPQVSIPSPSFVKLEQNKEQRDIVTITATVRNLSNSTNYGHYLNDYAAGTDIKVRFLDGEPGKGKQIGSDQMIPKLLPLEFRNVSVDWNVAQLTGRHLLTVQLFNPRNVIEAGGSREPAALSIPVDLDSYRRCRTEK